MWKALSCYRHLDAQMMSDKVDEFVIKLGDEIMLAEVRDVLLKHTTSEMSYEERKQDFRIQLVVKAWKCYDLNMPLHMRNRKIEDFCCMFCGCFRVPWSVK